MSGASNPQAVLDVSFAPLRTDMIDIMQIHQMAGVEAMSRSAVGPPGRYFTADPPHVGGQSACFAPVGA